MIEHAEYLLDGNDVVFVALDRYAARNIVQTISNKSIIGKRRLHNDVGFFFEHSTYDDERVERV